MNTMKCRRLMAAILLLGVAACNYTVGECWYRDQGNENVGAGVGSGGVVLPPGGDGDFGDVPPRQPLDAKKPGPKCNADPETDEGGAGGAGGKGAGGKGAGGSGASWTPEERAALDAIRNADPIEIAKRSDTAVYAAVTANNLIAAQGVGPSTLDATTASQLIDNVAPDAISEALGWEQSVDPSVFMAGVVPQFECIEPPHNCPDRIKCPKYPGWNCFVTNCGKGSCRSCPEFLSNLIIKGWCAYGCMKGSEDVGAAFILQTIFGDRTNGPWCFSK